MKISVICRQCKETFDFETDENKVLFKKFEPIKTPEIFVVRCTKCGTLNEVKVPVRK